MVWVCPYVSPDSLKYREARDQGILIRTPEGEPYIAKWWNGYSAVLDFSNPKAVQWLKCQLDALTAVSYTHLDRMKKVVFQLRFFILFPAIQALIGGILFTALTLKTRLFTGTEIMQFSGIMGTVYSLYVLIWFVMYEIMKCDVKKRLMKKR